MQQFMEYIVAPHERAVDEFCWHLQHIHWGCFEGARNHLGAAKYNVDLALKIAADGRPVLAARAEWRRRFDEYWETALDRLYYQLCAPVGRATRDATSTALWEALGTKLHAPTRTITYLGQLEHRDV